MKLLLLATVLSFGAAEGCDDHVNMPDINPKDPKNAHSIYDYYARDIDDKKVKLDKYKGLVTIVVNAATSWGLTKKNYKELGELITLMKKADCSLKVAVFHSNNFYQEPKTNAEIKAWNAGNEGKAFDIYSKILVNGGCEHPLYTYLKSKQGGWFGSAIKWNYTKFLIDRNGIPVARWGPNSGPMGHKDEILAQCKKKI